MLINGRPIKELRENDGVVVMMHYRNGLVFGSRSSDHTIRVGLIDINDYNFSEWVKVLKSEPKPDANGWWMFDEKQPEVGDLISCVWNDSPDFDGDDSDDGCVIRWDLRKRYANPYQWKPFIGPSHD